MTTITDFLNKAPIMTGFDTFGRHGYKDVPLTLDNGKMLINSFGKYRPDLVMLSRNEKIGYREITDRESVDIFNVPMDGFRSYVYRGNFFVSKKGNKVFEFTENGKFLLIDISIGRSFKIYHDGPIQEPSMSYYHVARSNGGGAGHVFIVIPLEWKGKLLSEEDI